jgi:voltage-gated potassium channel
LLRSGRERIPSSLAPDSEKADWEIGRLLAKTREAPGLTQEVFAIVRGRVIGEGCWVKYFTSQIMHFMRPASSRRNVKLLARFVGVLALIIAVFTVIFHVLMIHEGQEHSWVSGFYWTLVTMSTLGFGDITFHSDIGRFFSVVVILTGILFLLVLMPFTFIEFFYSPWMKAQQEMRAPREVPQGVSGHVIIANYDPVAASFIKRLEKYGFRYYLAVKSLQQALEFHDEGLNVVLADTNDAAAFQNLGIERAAMLVATSTDVVNTGIAFTAREISESLPIVATASSVDSIGVLRLAGCNHVIQLGELLGQSLARRTIATDAQAHVIGEVDGIQFAEATAAGTPLVGKTLLQSKVREQTGVVVIGVWESGRFRLPRAEDIITERTVFLLAGTEAQFDIYNGLFCIYHQSMAPVVIIGAGRVGRAAASALRQLETDFRIVDLNPERGSSFGEQFVCGSAADYHILERAGIEKAPAVIVTTHEDDMNVYLTIYCRKLRPDIQVLARSTKESNTPRLHRAGADLVMSYATMGAGILFNDLCKGGDLLMVAEGLYIFRLQLPAHLTGQKISESKIRERTGCSVVALRRAGSMKLNPAPDTILMEADFLILVGTADAEESLLRMFRALV